MQSKPLLRVVMFVLPFLTMVTEASAGDASFLPNDTISIQGYTATPNEVTIECRVWIPSGAAPVITSVSPPITSGGSIIKQQRNSGMDQALIVGPDGVALALYPLMWKVFPTTMPKNQWCHVAATRAGTRISVFVNGIQIASESCAADPMWVTTSPSLRIGAAVHNGAGQPNSGFLGRIDWIRVSSVARYTGNFTVPAEESLVPADAATELLLRFNDAAGANSVLDEGIHHFASVVGDTSSLPDATAPRFSGLVSCVQDLDGDGEVAGGDVSLLLVNWGPCPQ